LTAEKSKERFAGLVSGFQSRRRVGGDCPGAADRGSTCQFSHLLLILLIVSPVHEPVGFFARQKVNHSPTARSFSFGRHIEVELISAGFDFSAKLRLRVKSRRDFRRVTH
jgi:hypothetical protein